MVDEKKHKPAGDMRALRRDPDYPLAGPPVLESDEIEAPPPEPPEASEPTEQATVARGRCVHILDGTKVARGFDTWTGKTVFRQGFRTAVHPQVVTLGKSEIARLRATGHLIDPDRVAPPDATTVSAQSLHDSVAPGKVNGGTH